MKTIEIHNAEPTCSHGISAVSSKAKEKIYFCASGLGKVLGVGVFKKAELSFSPFKGALEVKVKGRVFSSKYGNYIACEEHPETVFFLAGKPLPKKTNRPPETFRFYIKVTE